MKHWWAEETFQSSKTQQKKYNYSKLFTNSAQIFTYTSLQFPAERNSIVSNTTTTFIHFTKILITGQIIDQ